MILRTAWIACTAALLSLSLSGASAPAGGFFVTRQQQRSRQQLVGQVQQPRREALISRLLEKGRRGDLLRGHGRLASPAAVAVGGEEAQQQSQATIEPAPTESSHDNTNDDSSHEVAVKVLNTARYTGLGRQCRGLASSLEQLSSRRQRVPHVWATAAAWGASNRGALILRARGGSAPHQSPSPSPSPPQQGDRWKYAVEGLKNGLASGLAAACVKTVLQPFDTMKTVQQFSTTRMTLLQAGRNLLARGGVPELYQGLGVTLIGSMPSVGVYFGLYQYAKRQMDAKDGMSPYVSIAVSAGLGNFVASLFRVPYEVVKQRLQVGQYPSTMIALRSIYREGGILGFFGKGGLQMQWARDIPYAMVTLLVYETLQKAAARRKGPPGSKAKEAKANPFENMIIGAIAGGMGSLVTNPMDMIKTRMMTSPELYAGPMDAVWKALSNEGPQAFMKGATPRLLHKIPANAFFFVAYEFFRNVLGVTR